MKRTNVEYWDIGNEREYVLEEKFRGRNILITVLEAVDRDIRMQIPHEDKFMIVDGIYRGSTTFRYVRIDGNECYKVSLYIAEGLTFDNGSNSIELLPGEIVSANIVHGLVCLERGPVVSANAKLEGKK